MENNQYLSFDELRRELETRGEKFSEQTLGLLRYRDLFFASIGNAGDAICDYSLILREQERRLGEFDKTPLKDLADCAEDDSMLYALFHRRANNMNLIIDWENAEKWLQLYHSMKALRGNWSEGRDSPFLNLIYDLIPEVQKENLVPSDWADAVKDNADAFDGHFVDGRIMRDGALRASPTIEKILAGANQNKTTPEFVSGNLARMLGATPMHRKGGYRGSYEELFEEMLNHSMRLKATTKVKNSPGFFYKDKEGYLQ